MLTNSRTTLITPLEVKMYSPADTEDTTTIRENFIILKEEKLFNLYFGWSFYEDLISTKIDYTTLSTYKGDYNPSTNYLAGDTVLYLHKLYNAKVNTVGQKPSNKLVWEFAPKFSNSNYDFLWGRYLRTILAFNVSHSSVLYSALKLTAQGLTKRKGEGFDAAELKEIQVWKKGIYNDIQDICYNMDLFIKRNATKYPLYKPLIQDEKCGAPKKRFPNYGFNVGGSRYADKPDLDELDDY